MHTLWNDPIGVIKEAVLGFLDDDGTGAAAEAAYRLVFALPALAIFFASVSSFAAEYTGVDAFDALLERAQEGLPEEVYSTLELVFEQVDEQSGFGILSIGLAIALWSGSNALIAMIKAINRAHGMEDERGIVTRRLAALGLTLGLSVLIISSFVLIIFGQAIGQQVAGLLDQGDVFTVIWNIARWPVLLVLFMAALATLYWLGPPERINWNAVIPGAAIATVIWIVASYGFSIYLQVAEPGSAYGVLGGLIALLLFLYLSSIVIVFGGEINAVIRNRLEGRTSRARRIDHPEAVMSSAPIANPATSTGARISTWVVVAILFVGAILGGLFRRGSG